MSSNYGAFKRFLDVVFLFFFFSDEFHSVFTRRVCARPEADASARSALPRFLLVVHKAETFTMPELELAVVLMVGATDEVVKELGDGRLMMAVVICFPLQFICARSLGFKLRLERQLVGGKPSGILFKGHHVETTANNFLKEA